MNEEVAAANQAGQLMSATQRYASSSGSRRSQSLRDSQKKLQQELADATRARAQADASKWSVEKRLVGTLQALENSDRRERDAARGARGGKKSRRVATRSIASASRRTSKKVSRCSAHCRQASKHDEAESI